ncbi:MAG: alpha/beta fold hydrolase, partial [Gammaproteobacteria bacterium]|nr:alpha/beta fold hydrolase [Gammaproteobacteria bacterium]
MNWARQAGGQGRTLVLLHGWGMEGRVFDPWLAYLTPHFRCVRYDLPGHGATPCAAGLAWEGSVTALAALLAEEGESPLLLGWSLGGLLALGLAA